MEPRTSLDRRSFLASTAVAATSLALPTAAATAATPHAAAAAPKKKIRQSVARWTYGNFKLEELCEKVAKIGITGIDLLHPGEWEVAKKFGLECSMAFGPGSINIGSCMNRTENHAKIVEECEKHIPKVGEAGIQNMILFSGNRGGQDDATGIQNCVKLLEKLVPMAEKANVTLCMEYLNSKVDHKDYAFDHMSYGTSICKAIGSPRVKILYDIYHAQIMEGDVIRTLRDNIQYIGHFHTGGVPGRQDIDDTQELYYPAICKAILATDYSGWVAHEFMPKKDPIETLARCVKICDV